MGAKLWVGLKLVVGNCDKEGAIESDGWNERVGFWLVVGDTLVLGRKLSLGRAEVEGACDRDGFPCKNKHEQKRAAATKGEKQRARNHPRYKTRGRRKQTGKGRAELTAWEMVGLILRLGWLDSEG